MGMLTASERRRLDKLTEELGEVLQVIGKIQLHGYEAVGPDGTLYNNRGDLEKELGDVMAAKQNMETMGEINPLTIEARAREKYPIIVAVTSTLE